MLGMSRRTQGVGTMRKSIALAFVAALAFTPALALAGCGGWESLTSGGIALESVERDDKGYIAEDAAKEAAFTMADVTEAEVMMVDTALDESSDPAKWIVDFDANGTSYHYVVNAENGDLIDFASLTL